MPDWKEEIARRLRSLKLPPAREAEIVEEVAQHLEDRYQELVAGGATEDAARRVALEELCDESLLARGLRRVEQEVPQEPVVMGGRSDGHILANLYQDMHYGLRALAKNPAFTAVAVITLALGIGANTAIFSVVEAVLLRPLPFHDPSRLVQLWETEAAPGHYPLTGPDYLDWQAQSRTLEGISLFDWGENFNASGAGEPEQAFVVRVQANFYSLLGVAPLIGRTFLDGEDQAGRDHVAVLSYGFWQRHFGGGRDAVGKNVDLNGEKYAVVGVMPAWFGAVGGAAIWVPIDMSPESLGPRGQHKYRAIGRLKPDVPATKVRAELVIIARRLGKQYPDSNSNVGAAVIPLKDQLVGDSRAELLILLGAVGLVLLIACVNVANLSLVRATGRHREVAVRRAVGASRGRVIRQLLTESVMLSLLGAVCGLLLGWGCLRLLAAAGTLPIPLVNPIALNGTVLAFTLAVGLLVGVLVGLAPALQVSQLQLNEELKTAMQAALGPCGRRRILRDSLVVGEIAISMALLIGAGLLLRSFIKLREVEVGINPQGVLTAQVVLPSKRYTTLDQGKAFFEQLVDGLKRAPGVDAAAVGRELPLRGGDSAYITIEGRESSAFQNILVEQNEVTPEYFRALGIPFLKGRNYDQQDLQNSAEAIRQLIALLRSGKALALPSGLLVAVINQTMARQFWPNQDPLGKVFKRSGVLPATVVGVVGDVKEWGIRQQVIPEAYIPLPFMLAPPVGAVSIVVKGAAGTTTGLPAAVRSQVHSLDSSLAVFNVRTMQEVLSESMTDTSYQSLLLSSFALLALLLTAVGIYGVMAYAVTQRTREIGIRLALGAEPRDVLSLVLRTAARLAGLGAVIGVAVALALTRLMATQLYGVQPSDPTTFVTVSLFLTGVVLVASYIPARRATKVDPVVALRYE